MALVGTTNWRMPRLKGCPMPGVLGRCGIQGCRWQCADGRPLKNTAHRPLWVGGQQFEKRVFFPIFWRFFVVFLGKILFLSFTMTSNAFSKTIQRFLKGS